MDRLGLSDAPKLHAHHRSHCDGRPIDDGTGGRRDADPGVPRHGDYRSATRQAGAGIHGHHRQLHERHGPTRSEALPDTPTVGEFVPGYEASTWSGVGAPKATPAEIVEKLNKEINAALADHKIKARLADLGSTPLVGSATDFGKLIADETEKWGNVIRAFKIKPE
jgi:hypothetical protein